MKPRWETACDLFGAAHESVEGFLGGIFGETSIAEDAKSGVENEAGVSLHEYIEGVGVAFVFVL